MTAQMTRVPFLDLGRLLIGSRDALAAACGRVIASGCFLNGSELAALEQELECVFPGSHVVGVGSGTQALQVLLLAHGIGPGDEVVTAAASFFATAKAISMVGARPVFADVSPGDFTIDPESVRRVITPRTRAILAVHLYGRPADMGALRAIAADAGIPLLEDAAQAFGASVNGIPAGCLSDGAALSFYPTKNLGALGDAGAVLLKAPALAERARSARFLGWDGVTRDWFPQEGISGRMDELQAAVLRVRLATVAVEQQRRRLLAERYRQALPAELLTTPPPERVVDAHHLFVIRHPDRAQIARRMSDAGVETAIHYAFPLHRQPPYRSDSGQRPVLPVAEQWANEVLSLPLNAALTEKEQDAVISALQLAL